MLRQTLETSIGTSIIRKKTAKVFLVSDCRSDVSPVNISDSVSDSTPEKEEWKWGCSVGP